jgi:hypothetical protein
MPKSPGRQGDGLVARLDEPRVVSRYHGLYAAPHIELAQYGGDVALDGRLADVELARDLRIR